MFNEANKKQVLEMQSEFYKDRIGKVYGDYKVIDVWYDWEQHRQMWKLQCQRCGAIKVTKNGREFAKGRVSGTCPCRSRERAQEIAKEKERARQERIAGTRADPEWIGQVIGTLEVIKYAPGKGLLTRCRECGKEVYHDASELSREKPIRCRCQKDKYSFDPEEWIGKKIGHLTVLSKENNKFLCRCDCGRKVSVIPTNLANGTIKSCGNSQCPHHRSLITTHGLSNDRLYRIWRGMKERCYNPKNQGWPTYGGRGIDICDEWIDDLFAFREWALSHGYADNLSIDRIDNDRGYSPDNCRWATAKEQANNQHPRYTFSKKPDYTPHKRKIIWEINGETKSGLDWCKQYGMSMPFVKYRIEKMGMSPYEALTTPKHTTGRPRKTKIEN